MVRGHGQVVGGLRSDPSLSIQPPSLPSREPFHAVDGMERPADRAKENGYASRHDALENLFWFFLFFFFCSMRTTMQKPTIARVYFRAFRACLTRFSMTPSKASRSPIISSVRHCQ